MDAGSAYLPGVLYSCAAALCWALGPVFLKKGLVFFDRVEMNAARTVGFAGASLLFCVLDPNAFVLWRFPAHLLSYALLNILVGNLVGDFCFFRSLELIGVSRAVGTTSVYPLFVAAISFFWLGESITLSLVLGTAVMIGGLPMLKFGGRGAGGEEDGGKASMTGFLLALLTALLWASTMALQKWLLTVHQLPAATITFWRSLFLLAFSWGYWGWRGRKAPGKRSRLMSAPREAWISALAAGAFGLAAGGYVFALAIRIIPVSVATPITATSPLIAAAMAVAFFGESMHPVQWAGILCIIGGVITVGS